MSKVLKTPKMNVCIFAKIKNTLTKIKKLTVIVSNRSQKKPRLTQVPEVSYPWVDFPGNSKHLKR